MPAPPLLEEEVAKLSLWREEKKKDLAELRRWKDEKEGEGAGVAKEVDDKKWEAGNDDITEQQRTSIMQRRAKV